MEGKLLIVPVTDDNRQALVNLALSMHLGEKCICGHVFKEIEELKDTVWFPHKGGRIIHRECYWKDNKKAK
jgi:hypothetical protein